MRDEDKQLFEHDGAVYEMQIVNVITTYEPDSPGPMIDPQTGEMLEFVDEWVTIRCTRCSREGRIAKPPPEKAANAEGVYLGLCATCAAGTPLAEPLNRAERRRKGPRN